MASVPEAPARDTARGEGRGGAGRSTAARRARWGRDETCPVSTGGGTRRVQLVREGGGPSCARTARTPRRSSASTMARAVRSPAARGRGRGAHWHAMGESGQGVAVPGSGLILQPFSGSDMCALRAWTRTHDTCMHRQPPPNSRALNAVRSVRILQSSAEQHGRRDVEVCGEREHRR